LTICRHANDSRVLCEPMSDPRCDDGYQPHAGGSPGIGRRHGESAAFPSHAAPRLAASAASHQTLHARRHALGGDAVEGHDLAGRGGGLAALPAHHVAFGRAGAQQHRFERGAGSAGHRQLTVPRVPPVLSYKRIAPRSTAPCPCATVVYTGSGLLDAMMTTPLLKLLVLH